jgi:hypothetical protein
MRKAQTAIAAIMVTILVGCATWYTGTVTITAVVDSAMRNWAQMSVAGKTSAAIDVKVIAAHNQYRAACAVAQTALISYKANGDQAQYIAAITAVRSSVDALFALITPLLSPAQSTSLQTQLAKAQTL